MYIEVLAWKDACSLLSDESRSQNTLPNVISLKNSVYVHTRVRTPVLKKKYKNTYRLANNGFL